MSKKKKAAGAYIGSFDPPTKGHIWVIEKGSKMYDKLFVTIGINPEKKTRFSVEDRLEMIKECTKNIPNLVYDISDNKFMVDYANSVGAKYLLRGVRNFIDLQYETDIKLINFEIDASIETEFLMPPPKLRVVSSSLVKGMVGFDRWEERAAKYVPRFVLQKLKEDYLRRQAQ